MAKGTREDPIIIKHISEAKRSKTYLLKPDKVKKESRDGETVSVERGTDRARS
jgi:co-chaperonin GroES (HSP10)